MEGFFDYIVLRKLDEILTRIEKLERIMATVPAGLASLQKADADLATAIATVIADIVSLSAQLSAVNSEDPAVASIAADLETKVTALNAAVTPTFPVTTPLI